MTNITNVVKAVQTMLSEDSEVMQIMGVDRKIERGSFVNVDPNLTPWIGVYKGELSYVPRTLGYRNWQTELSIRIIAQTTNLRSSEECEDSLNTLVDKITDAITSDLTLSGTVDLVNNFKVEYGYVETDRSSLFYQSAMITIQAEVIST